MDDLSIFEAIILVGAASLVLRFIQKHNMNKALKKIHFDNIKDDMENMRFSPITLEGYTYSIGNSKLVYRREDGNDPQDFIREELRLADFGELFLIGKGGPGTVYYENPIKSRFVIGSNEIAEWMNRILPFDYMLAAEFLEKLVADVQPPLRGERCHAAMIKQDIKSLLLPKLPLSEKNIEVFKCARKMLMACENGYIERSFIVYTEQMEELTENTGKWRIYGDLARPYIGLYRDEWPKVKSHSEFRKAFL